MKKFISMVMAAAMVVSLVPATAFAATGTVEADRATLVDGVTKVEDFKTNNVEGFIDAANAPEVMIRLDEAESADGSIKQEIKVKLDGAKWATAAGAKVEDAEKANGTAAVAAEMLGLFQFEGTAPTNNDNNEVGTLTIGSTTFTVTVDKFTNTTVTYVLAATASTAAADLKGAIDGGQDTITIDLQSLMNKTNSGATAKVSVTSDIAGAEISEKVFAEIEAKGIDAELDDEVQDVAVEEIVAIDPIDVEPSVGDTFAATLDANDRIKLTLSKGFEFDKTANVTVGRYTVVADDYADDDEIVIANVFDAQGDITTDKLSAIIAAADLTISGIKVEATTAKAGDEATLTIKFGDADSVKIVVAKVIEEGLVISVDEDDDVPVMWSGVRADNYGLTADTDEHVALEVTIEETFEGSYNDKDEIELTLPEGVYVVGFTPGTEDVVVNGEDAQGVANDLEDAFVAAYQEGDHKSFIFEKRAFAETEPGDGVIEFSFELTLVADPGFVGDVVMEMLVDGEKAGEVTIAKFESPMFVEAEQNDLKIDYRNTEVPTEIVIKEAEAGLWKKGEMAFAFALDHGIDFEKDATFTVNEDDSDMEIDGDNKTLSIDNENVDTLYVEIDAESDDEPGVITISDISLYMSRNLAAGAYDLEMVYNSAVKAYKESTLFGYDVHSTYDAHTAQNVDCDKECVIDDVTDMSDVVKEAFINIVTAGREQDDASFTTKVVVPVGEAYMIAGETTITLDVPAYVSEAGYTMLPVRAVATALGINNNNVLWDQATKTVTILYGQRIITMAVGSKVINVNGSAIPASASVEVVNGRTFLPMRDLATALGVTDITWDAATKTATLNGNI